MSFPLNSRIKDLKKLPAFRDVGDYIIYMPGIMGVLMGGMRINAVFSDPSEAKVQVFPSAVVISN